MERIPIVDHPLYSVTVGQVAIHLLIQTAARECRYVVRVGGAMDAPGGPIREVLFLPDDLINLETAVRKVREWFEQYPHQD